MSDNDTTMLTTNNLQTMHYFAMTVFDSMQ